MPLPIFNQDNVDSKITEVKSLPQTERDAIADEITNNFKTWLNANFAVPNSYNLCMDAWPTSVHQEVGYVVGLAVRSTDWNIVAVFPGGNPQNRCGHFEDSVSTSYNYNTGQVVTTKTLKWQWD